jgi:STE24 endopeptidase
MQIVVLAAFMVALTLAEQPALVDGRWVFLPALVGYLAAAVAAAAFRTALSLRAMGRRDELSPSALRRHGLLSMAAQVWLVAGLAGVILLGYGRWVLRGLGLAHVPLVGEVVLLLPFLVALVLDWLLEYPFYRAMRLRLGQGQLQDGAPPRPGWTLGEYIEYNLRHNVLFIAAPVGLIVLASDSLSLAAPLLPAHLAEPVVLGASAAWSALVFVLAPVLIVRVWRTRRLPDGLLREALLHTCRQLRLKVRELLLWRTGGMIVNAGVMGLVAPVRYVLLTDALLERMDRRQVLAVFAHEAGHILSHHLFYSVLFAMVSVSLCSLAGDWAVERLGGSPAAAQAASLGLLLATWGVLFGFISRRFERQSDVIGAWASGPAGPDPSGRVTPEGAAVFASALQRVAELSGIPPRQRKWRHGSIASRVEYIFRLSITGAARNEIDRVVRRIKAALWVAAGVALALWTLRALHVT